MGFQDLGHGVGGPWEWWPCVVFCGEAMSGISGLPHTACHGAPSPQLQLLHAQRHRICCEGKPGPVGWLVGRAALLGLGPRKGVATNRFSCHSPASRLNPSQASPSPFPLFFRAPSYPDSTPTRCPCTQPFRLSPPQSYCVPRDTFCPYEPWDELEANGEKKKQRPRHTL